MMLNTLSALLATLALAALAIASPAVPAAAEADPLLSRLTGEWVGRGTARREPQAAPERVTCRLRASLTPDGQRLQQSGRCALSEDTRSITSELAAQGAGLYSGTWDAGSGRSPVRGRGGEGELVLAIEQPTPSAQAAPTVSLALTGEGRYTMTMTGVDLGTGAVFEAGRILFERQ